MAAVSFAPVGKPKTSAKGCFRGNEFKIYDNLRFFDVPRWKFYSSGSCGRKHIEPLTNLVIGKEYRHFSTGAIDDDFLLDGDIVDAGGAEFYAGVEFL